MQPQIIKLEIFSGSFRETDLINVLIKMFLIKAQAVDDKGNISYKDEHKYADHMQEKTEAVSVFAKKKTLQQQRQFLPIFAVRHQVLYS